MTASTDLSEDRGEPVYSVTPSAGVSATAERAHACESVEVLAPRLSALDGSRRELEVGAGAMLESRSVPTVLLPH